MDFAEAMRAFAQDDAPVPPAPDIVAQTLRDALAAYDRVHHFERGDLVAQKGGLAKYELPAIGQPAIFIRYLDAPEAKGEAGDNDAEHADCIIGVRMPSGTMFLITAVAARFEPWRDASDTE